MPAGLFVIANSERKCKLYTQRVKLIGQDGSDFIFAGNTIL